MRFRVSLIGVLVLMLLVFPQAALAAVPGQSVPGESNLGFLLAGSALAWAAFFAYTFYVSGKNRELRRELDELRRMLADRESSEPR